MKVKLINFTRGALDLLILTKSGRLDTGTNIEEIMMWTHEKKLDHLSYMMDTIKTSFEFVDYVFDISEVSRTFTHQVVRTRTAGFQQESQRAVDVRDHDYIKTTDHPSYKKVVEMSLEEYAKMIDDGVHVQDAREILPPAIHTRIFVKANLRTLSNMAELRLCKRTQGQYQEVFKEMVEQVLLWHPWAAPLLKVHCVKYGICAFPRYTKCPVQKHCLDPKLVREKVEEVWSKSNHVANPVVNKNGVTM